MRNYTKQDLDRMGLGEYIHIFHKKGEVRKNEVFSEERIKECIPILIAEENNKACLEQMRKIADEKEAERKQYVADLKAHPEKYINRKGLIAKGLKPGVVKTMTPLFFKFKGQAKEYWYYNY